ncbi:MAG TPA: hypothetical protein V6C52_05450 [Coleofasciculaceae cyanobacterium]|jgi:hypothetical protein
MHVTGSTHSKLYFAADKNRNLRQAAAEKLMRGAEKVSKTMGEAYEQSHVLEQQAKLSGNWKDQAQCAKNTAKYWACGVALVGFMLPVWAVNLYKKATSGEQNSQ